MASEDVTLLSDNLVQLAVSTTETCVLQDEKNPQNTLSKLTSMRKDKILTDIVLQSCGVEIPCHRNVIAAASDYFLHMFTTQDQPQGTVKMDNIKPNILQAIVEFIYTSKIQIPVHQVMSIVKACKELGIESLKSVCDEFIAGRITPDNCMGFHAFATTYGLVETKQATTECLLENPDEILRKASVAEYKCINEESMVDWIRDDKVKVSNESVIFRLVEKWLQSDPARMNETTIDNLIAHVRLPLCTPEFLVGTVEESKIMKTRYCFKLINEAKTYMLVPGMKGKKMTDRTKPRVGKAASTQLFILGGGESDDKGNTTCWSMNIGEEGDYKEFTTLPTALSKFPFSFATCTVNDSLYITGGSSLCGSGMDKTNQAWEYNMTKGQWNQLAPMTQARDAHGMVAVGKCIYVIGGFHTGLLTSVEKYSLETRKWVSVAPLVEKAYHNPSVHIGDYIYTISGKEGVVQRYDIPNNTWNRMKNMPEKCAGCPALTSQNQTIFLTGGRQALCLSYNTEQDTWTKLSSPSVTRVRTSAVLLENTIILGGGCKVYGGEGMDTIEQYDITQDKWSKCPWSLPSKLIGHSMLLYTSA